MKNYLSGTVNGTSLESRDESDKSRDSQSGEDDKCSQKSYPLQDSSVVAVEVVPGPGPQLISEFLEEDLPTVVCEEITATEATDLSVRLLEDVRDKIMNFELKKNDSDSFEKQLAILKNTKCSIYGASGAAVVPFFVNTPTFTQQTKEEGFRLELGWERKLMDFKHFKNFDKYHNSEIYDSSVDELFTEFLSFYKEL